MENKITPEQAVDALQALVPAPPIYEIESEKCFHKIIARYILESAEELNGAFSTIATLRKQFEESMVENSELMKLLDQSAEELATLRARAGRISEGEFDEVQNLGSCIRYHQLQKNQVFVREYSDRIYILRASLTYPDQAQPQTCPDCNGLGEIFIQPDICGDTKPCPRCFNSGVPGVIFSAQGEQQVDTIMPQSRDERLGPNRCHAFLSDQECFWDQCPQQKEGHGKSCPLPWHGDIEGDD